MTASESIRATETKAPEDPRDFQESAPHASIRPRAWLRRIYHRAVMRAAVAWLYSGCQGKVFGSEQMLAVPQGCIIAPNHVSYLDWMVLGGLFHYRFRQKVVFLAKQSLFTHALWGPLMLESRSVKVSNDGAAIMDRQGFRSLRKARHIAIFPEGTRSHDGTLGFPHLGMVKLAARLGKPIVPTALAGFYDSWPRHRRLPRPRACAIAFGEPLSIPVECASDDALALHHTELVMARIADLLKSHAPVPDAKKSPAVS